MEFTVGKKLYSGFLIIVLLMGTLGWIGITKLGQLNDSTKFITNEKIPALYTITEMKYIISENFGIISEHIISPDDESMLRKEEEYKTNKKKLDKLFIEYEKYITTKNERNLIDKIKNEIGLYNNFVNNVFTLSAGNNDDEAIIKVANYQEKINEMTMDMDQLVALNMQFAEDASKKASNLYQSGLSESIIFISISLFFAIGVAFFITRGISKPLVSVTDTLKLISDGDLTMEPLKIRNRDEIGLLVSSLNKMLIDLNATVLTANNSAIQVASSSEELFASAEQSTNASEQLSNLVQTNAEGVEIQLNRIDNVSASLGQMVKRVKDISNNSTEMDKSTKITSKFVEKGMTSVETVVHRIQDIKASFNQMNAVINSLDNRSKEIGNILALITDISNQTNLLALNAAIEAARAGEHGKGFAVVADEVRKLAEESKKSADQIAEMIIEIQTETKNAVLSIDEGNLKVLEGISSTEEAKQSFNDIKNSMSDVSNKVTDVSVSIQDIEAISLNISMALENVRDIAEKSVTSSLESSAATEEQLATMEEIASSAQSLSSLAEELHLVISKFKIKG
ncbi:methyl-accepting chemotaxis protein [Niallia sp. RD1]|uniref:HAMP domain-containing methyl-accepting chemotaxis protein n=1 Tax=Niallia sp. RD1 TaxID=2962858 RepID=UPI0020C18B01|nr:HAMP domain-containing methyl-accepting chemotaxis protein [Niallia sp. RD1]UTI42852.1 methyl-accepting chemotaxis protein [Niallia sp. RD1]